MATRSSRRFAHSGWGEQDLALCRTPCASKNLHWLIGQFAETRQSKALGKTVLVLVGDGAEEQSLRSEVNKMGIQGRVIFAGRKEGEELYAAMSAADALVLCSHVETYGAVVAEAMQWGTPCMVRDTCGAKVLVNDANGCVFQVEDAEGFRIAAEKTLSLKRGMESILPVSLDVAIKDFCESLMHYSNMDFKNEKV